MSDKGTTCSHEDRIKGIMYSEASAIRSTAKLLSPRSKGKTLLPKPREKERERGGGRNGEQCSTNRRDLLCGLGP